MKPKKQFKPQNLRTLLATLFVLMLLAGGAGFYKGLDTVSKYAVDVNHLLASADASTKEVSQLQALENSLTQSSSLITKADQLFATPASYQSQVSLDLKRYADAAGLSITANSFSDPVQSGTHAVTITLKQTPSYTSLISFLNNVEGNLPKLQVSSISLGRPANGGADRVKTGDIKIDIAVR